MVTMRIGIDGASWTNARGYGRFTRELVGALSREDCRNSYTLFLDASIPRAALPPNVHCIPVSTRVIPTYAASADGYRSPQDLFAFCRAIASARLDVIFFPTVYTFVPVLRPRRIVVGVHDVIPERFPQYVFKSARARLFWMLKTQLALGQATRVLTVSEHARQGLVHYFYRIHKKIRVTSEAPAPAFRVISDRELIQRAFESVGLKPDSRALMYWGGITPHKNVEMLVRVFADLVQEERFADVKLLIVGDYENEVFYSEFPALRAQVEATCRDSVLFTGYVSDETAARLLNGVQACVLPSFEEGFGLPGIEAAACGAPLIATQASALPEVLGDAAIYIDPTQPTQLRAALERVLEDAALRHTLRTRGSERAQRLTWDSAARRVMQVFEELA